MPDQTIREIFSRNLNHYLEINECSQADLARHMHVSTASTAKWCTGQAIPRMDKIQSICNWLGIEKSDLLEDRNESSPSYYLDSESLKAAEFLHKNPNYKVLFDATKKVKPEDIDFVRKMIDRMTDSNDDTGC